MVKKNKGEQQQPKKLRRSHRNNESARPGEFVVDSFGAVEEFLKFRPQAITALKVHQRHAERLAARWQPYLASNAIKLSLSSREHLNVEASVRLDEVDETELGLLLSSTPAPQTLVAIDHITDPRNLGAIVRSAAFFGVRFVIVPRDRQAQLTAATVATSMGGFALVDMVVVTNLARTLRSLREDFNYQMIGADGDGVDVGLQTFHPHNRVLVLGSEDRGLSKNISEVCDFHIAVCGAPRRVESLNVGVAAGILLQHLTANLHQNLIAQPRTPT